MADGTSSYFGSKTWTGWTASDTPNIDSDNDTAGQFAWPYPVDVYRLQLVATTAVVNAAGTVVIEVYIENTLGGTGDTLVTTWTCLGTTTLAAGRMSIVDLTLADTNGETAEDGTTRYVAPVGPIRVEPGQSLVLKVTEPSDSGVVRAAAEYIPDSYPNTYTPIDYIGTTA